MACFFVQHPIPPPPTPFLQVVVEMVKGVLAQPDAQEKGWLLDGYPRSGEQAEAIEKESIRPDVFLLVNVRQGCDAGGTMQARPGCRQRTRRSLSPC